MIIAAWVLALILMTLFFANWLEGEHNPNQSVQGIRENGISEVVLQRNRQGHYVATGLINDRKVTLMLDTGATVVAVPQHLADELGLVRGQIGYSQTANGTVQVAETTIHTLQLGTIRLQQIPASILPDMGDDTILLGMSFLRDLEFIQRGDQLTIRQYH